MQIIFDEKLVPELREKYVVLELDTVKQPKMAAPITLYALIETIEFDKISRLPELCQQHQTMIEAYKNSKWDDAKFNAYALKGSWRGELDEFYESVISTVDELSQTNTIWDGIKHTIPSED